MGMGAINLIKISLWTSSCTQILPGLSRNTLVQSVYLTCMSYKYFIAVESKMRSPDQLCALVKRWVNDSSFRVVAARDKEQLSGRQVPCLSEFPHCNCGTWVNH